MTKKKRTPRDRIRERDRAERKAIAAAVRKAAAGALQASPFQRELPIIWTSEGGKK